MPAAIPGLKRLLGGGFADPKTSQLERSVDETVRELRGTVQGLLQRVAELEAQTASLQSQIDTHHPP